jgi:chondroitin AC lyase
LPVVTTINQVFLNGDVIVQQGEQMLTLPQGDHVLKDVKWVYHDRIGYILPESGEVNVSNQTEQGRWSDLTDQKNISDELISGEVFNMGFNHGNSPNNASYQYIVVPDVTEQELIRTGSDNRQIEILSNSSEIQAVRNNKLDMYQMAFYKSGEVALADGSIFSMDSQGMAMLKMQGTRIEELTVSDPSRKLSRISVTVPGIYQAEGDNFAAYPDPDQNHTQILIDLPQDVYAGKSVTIAL